jgi:hypothetical protein
MAAMIEVAKANNLAPSPQKYHTNIRSITEFLIDNITNMGLDVFVSFSRRSSSRYLEINTERKEYIIRIADHPFSRGHFDFDIFVERPRRGSTHYLVFIDQFTKIVKKDRRFVAEKTKTRKI